MEKLWLIVNLLKLYYKLKKFVKNLLKNNLIDPLSVKETSIADIIARIEALENPPDPLNPVSPGDNNTPITLPANFSNTNYIVNCSRVAASYFTEYELAIRKMETNKITVACFGMANTPSINITLYVMAIGTWK